MDTTRWRVKACTTTRSCGAPSAPVRTWPASAAVTQMTGTVDTATKMKALRTVGVPYSDEDIATAGDAVKGKTEMDALVAYLQVLGTALQNKR